jgi:hypothetical protein
MRLVPESQMEPANISRGVASTDLELLDGDALHLVYHLP